jgi:tetratricopeptide (TPR) repeat protein
LAALFGFAGLFFGLRSLRARTAGAWFFTLGATAAFLLSALSKELGLIFPLLWIVILATRKNWTGVRNAVAIAVSVTVVYLSLRLPAEHIPPPPPRSSVPLLVRPLIAARAVAEYTGLLLLPLHLHMDRDVETNPTGFDRASLSRASWRELQNLLGLVLIAAALYWLWRARHTAPVFICLLLALLCYLPFSCIVGLNASVAEHWLYLPSAFLFLAASLSCVAFLQRARDGGQKTGPFLMTAACVLWILFLGARTFVRTFDWKDQRTFLTRNIAAGGDSSRTLTNLGGLDLAEGYLPEARKNLQAALKKSPDQPFALLNLAAVDLKENDFKGAHEILQRATRNQLVAAQANDLLAVLEYKEHGRVDLLRMRLAARTGPPNWTTQRHYIEVLNEAGYPEKAIAELKTCLETQWYRAESWELLSTLLAKTGRTEDAARCHAIALQYDVHLR